MMGERRVMQETPQRLRIRSREQPICLPRWQRAEEVNITFIGTALKQDALTS